MTETKSALEALEDLDLLEEIGWFPEQDDASLQRRFDRIRAALSEVDGLQKELEQYGMENVTLKLSHLSQAEEITRLLAEVGKYAAAQILFYERIDELKAARAVQEVTVEDISQHIRQWRFDDQYDCGFGEYLMKKYPHGLVVKEK